MTEEIIDNTNTVIIEDGKYAITGLETGQLRALRHGQPWRELVGDKLVLALAQEIRKLRGQLDRLSPQTRCTGNRLTETERGRGDE